MNEKNYFTELNEINVNDKVEKKGRLTYLSWTYAWGKIKEKYPNANYVVYENTLPNGYVVNYFTDGKTSYVKVGVEINGINHIEYLPVMDYNNKSILLEKLTSFDVNTAIQRALTKAIARHGLGLYIYAGEDLPQVEQEQVAEKPNQQVVSGEETYCGKTQAQWLKDVQDIYEKLPTEKKARTLEWCSQKGYGTRFEQMHISVLAVVYKALTR